MKITWKRNTETRWDSDFVSAEGRATFWGAHINARDTRISLEVACNGVHIHAEQCPTLADAKARGAEVLRALCGGPVLKSATVWCGVDPKGRVMPEAIGKTREAAWWALVWSLSAEVQNPKQAKAAGFTVRRFRLEEVR